ncbi:hypothetical protein DJ42_5496 [Bacillus anthracis]|nr:hypothetical protein DJ42_5496 [Bacillus anthracis]
MGVLPANYPFYQSYFYGFPNFYPLSLVSHVSDTIHKVRAFTGSSSPTQLLCSSRILR